MNTFSHIFTRARFEHRSKTARYGAQTDRHAPNALGVAALSRTGFSRT